MKEYEIITEFICCGNNMLVIKFENATLVMSEEDWRWMYGQIHPELWKDGKRVSKRRKTVA